MRRHMGQPPQTLCCGIIMPPAAWLSMPKRRVQAMRQAAAKHSSATQREQCIRTRLRECTTERSRQSTTDFPDSCEVLWTLRYTALRAQLPRARYAFQLSHNVLIASAYARSGGRAIDACGGPIRP